MQFCAAVTGSLQGSPGDTMLPLSSEPRQVCFLQSWQQHNGVQYHKVREAHAHNTTANAPHQQQPAELPHGQVPHSWAATPHWGLVTTARVSPGDILLTVPHHSLVVSQSPEQTMIQMAALAYDQATDWYSRTSLDHMGGVESFQQAEAEAQVVQARQKGQQQVDASQGSLLAEAKSFGVEQGQERQAEGVSQELVLAGLVEDWLQPGKIVLGLPGSLLMAQLWPEHESSGLGCQCIQALAGEVALLDCSKPATIAGLAHWCSTQPVPKACQLTHQRYAYALPSC